MKVLVVGANGKIGHQIVEKLHQDSAYTVRAMVRKEDQAAALKEKGIDAYLANLEDTVDNLAGAVKGMDAVIFSAGSGGSTGADKTLLIDLDGAVKMMEAAKKEQVDRFVMVSAFGADSRERWSEAIKSYYVAKYYADRELMQTDLNYTIVRPGALLDEAGTGKVKIAALLDLEGSDKREVPREDVANVVIESLQNEQTYRKAFDLISGEEAITDALNQL